MNLLQQFQSSSSPPVRCQKCRFHLFNYSDVVDSHEKSMEETALTHSCSTHVWYVMEDRFPLWMKNKFDSGDWVKGKMNCPQCDARIGSYNFISGMKCSCGSNVLPPIHIVKSRVDLMIPPRNVTNINSNSIESIQKN